MNVRGRPAADAVVPERSARIGVITGAIWMVFSAIVASIYPAMMWWYLSRPAARAACMKRPEPELSETDPQWETTV